MSSRTNDVFLCYSWKNQASALALHAALTASGLRVYLDQIGGEDWEPLGESVLRELRRSRTLVALITPEFPLSPHCRDELHLALHASYYLDEGRTTRVLAVVQGVSPDHVRPRQLSSIRLARDGKQLDDVASSIARVVEQHAGTFGDAPEPATPRWFPEELAGDPDFIGRHAELWELHEGLRSRAKTRDRGHAVVYVRGKGDVGGLGKTALCLRYAQLFQRDHPGGVFLLQLGGSGDATDDAVWGRYREQLALICERMMVDDPGKLTARLADIDEDYLWIVDDVPTTVSNEVLDKLVAPTSRGRTVVTTRRKMAGHRSSTVELDSLSPQDAGAVLTSHRRAGPGDRKAVNAITTMLTGHPQTLRLVSGLTTLPDFASYPILLDELSSPEPERLETAQYERELPFGCAKPFARALLRSADALDNHTKKLLFAASVLAPTVIPHGLLHGVARRLGAGTPAEVDNGLRGAAERGLIDLTNTAGPTMHALIARSLRFVAEPPLLRAQLRDAAVTELASAVTSTRDSYQHRAVLHHLPHVRAVAGLLVGGDRWSIGENERYLLNETGRTQAEAGDFHTALGTYEALNTACDTNHDLDAYTRYAVRANLGVAHGVVGHRSISLAMKHEAHQGFVIALGVGAPDTLIALNNLAQSLLDAKMFNEAHAKFREAYVAQRDHVERGPFHRETLKTLSNLAIARGHLGDTPSERNRHLRVAQRYWRAVHRRWLKVSRPEDQYSLDPLNGLALNFRALGDLDRALEVTTELLGLRIELLGDDHPDTIGTLENKLVIEDELGRDTHDGFRMVLARRLGGQGPEHPDTMKTLRNLIISESRSPLRTQGKLADLPDGDFEPAEDDYDALKEELNGATVALHCQRVAEFGSDDPRTLMATCYLAYTSALCVGLGIPAEQAVFLIGDAYEGLADATDEHVDHLGEHDLRIAEAIREWIGEIAPQSED
ncbi:hypothetical protein ED92_17170 [Amycolatopsis sp. MJM2582]|uniref:tetratricopeptide repeat protein n=1 Tax=Amycolatopsis sp. MJM2582 TaxID=1427749 RepID=UPI00050191C4|nr:toll/interleukin-1 receptor domain-containing protein [Amycolatopsis sp. MJM2582]KFZ81971.1 hypothetical protein ED92_17170 [Amycolatopsis sp. MJM2582]